MQFRTSVPVLLATLFCIAASKSTTSALDEANRIMSTMKSSHYAHHENVDAEKGIYDLDCSHFVGLVLDTTNPGALKDIPKENKYKYPRAFRFCDYFREVGNGEHWQSVAKLSDAIQGDIISWRMAQFDPGKDTGHVAILTKSPKKLTADTYAISVIDASEVRHYADSRIGGANGIGTGELHIRVNSDDQPIAVKFNEHARWHDHLFGIGRLKDSSTAVAIHPSVLVNSYR